MHIAAFLGKNSIKHRTLTTNLSKAVINDLCSFFETYKMFVSDTDDVFVLLDNFEKKYVYVYRDNLKMNETFNSAYIFLKVAIKKY